MRVNKNQAPLIVDDPLMEGRYVGADDYLIAFETFRADADGAPAFRGLPDDRCQCPHWGYVLAGEFTMTFADHSETYRSGDAYYIPPGHLPRVTAGTSVVEFSPAKEHAETMAVVGANLAAMSEAAQS